ncbi:MAG: hypothetical protein M3Q99_06320 [Acidobacteriota bacterium]|nr:hypothetical protein [Acidobacteriota bacterium]
MSERLIESVNERRDEYVKKIESEKPFEYIVQNLENTFGEPKLKRKSDPLSMLINIILSQATSDANSDRTFRNLKKRFTNWENVLVADESEIADAIRLGRNICRPRDPLCEQCPLIEYCDYGAARI